MTSTRSSSVGSRNEPNNNLTWGNSRDLSFFSVLLLCYIKKECNAWSTKVHSDHDGEPVWAHCLCVLHTDELPMINPWRHIYLHSESFLIIWLFSSHTIDKWRGHLSFPVLQQHLSHALHYLKLIVFFKTQWIITYLLRGGRIFHFLLYHGAKGYAIPEIGDNSIWALWGKCSPPLKTLL